MINNDKKINKLIKKLKDPFTPDLVLVFYDLIAEEFLEINSDKWTEFLLTQVMFGSMGSWYVDILIAENAMIVGCDQILENEEALRNLSYLKQQYRKKFWNLWLKEHGTVTKEIVLKEINCLNKKYLECEQPFLDNEVSYVLSKIIYRLIDDLNGGTFSEQIGNLLNEIGSFNKDQIFALKYFYEKFLEESSEYFEKNDCCGGCLIISM